MTQQDRLRYGDFTTPIRTSRSSTQFPSSRLYGSERKNGRTETPNDCCSRLERFITMALRLIRREFPRLCRGGSKSLTVPEVCFSSPTRHLSWPEAYGSFAFDSNRLRSGPFEGPAIVIPPALPEDTYWKGNSNLSVQLLMPPASLVL